MEVWPPGSRDIIPFDYLKCGVSKRDINKFSHKKQSLITTIMEVSSNIPRKPPREGAYGSGRGWRRSLLPRAILYGSSTVNTQLNNLEQFHYAAIPNCLSITISIFI
jgi:hypothetical protein